MNAYLCPVENCTDDEGRSLGSEMRFWVKQPAGALGGHAQGAERVGKGSQELSCVNSEDDRKRTFDDVSKLFNPFKTEIG